MSVRIYGPCGKEGSLTLKLLSSVWWSEEYLFARDFKNLIKFKANRIWYGIQNYLWANLSLNFFTKQKKKLCYGSFILAFIQWRLDERTFVG